MFIVTLWSNTANTHNLLSNQLRSHAQDTATSMSMSLTPHIANQEELVIAKTMTDMIFDSGFYASITLSDAQGNIMISRATPSDVENIPAWFITFFNIDAPSAAAKIYDGLTTKATLLVKSNASAAYKQMWTNAVRSFQIAFVVFGAAFVMILLLVKRVISNPLNIVIKQTEAISRQQFTQILEVPKTVELRKFVAAVNFMSGKLSKLFKQLSEQSETYRLFAYTDPLTKVGNRRAFQLYIEQLLRNETDHTSGHLLIVSASSLVEVNKAYGGDIGDHYLVGICATAKEVLSKHFAHFSIYRINGADFALIVENTKTEQVVTLAEALAVSYKRIEKNEYSQGSAHIGISAFAFNEELSKLMKRADNALTVAKDNTKRWELSENLPATQSNDVWQNKIQSILDVGVSGFMAQAIVNREQEVEYSEWFARLPNEQRSASLPMAELIPASIRLDHAQKLDKLIVSNLLEKLQRASSKVGVNLSRLSLFDIEFMDWFVDKLEQAGDQCEFLVVEISERTLVHDIESLLVQTNRLKSMGIKIAVEHFGAQLAGIRHLRKLAPDYLKIDGSFTKNIRTEIDNQLFIHSLVNVAHGLNIKVIAEMIETEAERDWLMTAQIDYFQGYFIAAPKPVSC